MTGILLDIPRKKIALLAFFYEILYPPPSPFFKTIVFMAGLPQIYIFPIFQDP